MLFDDIQGFVVSIDYGLCEVTIASTAITPTNDSGARRFRYRAGDTETEKKIEYAKTHKLLVYVFPSNDAAECRVECFPFDAAVNRQAVSSEVESD